MARTTDTSCAVLFAGGGTGGHLFPSIAIAEQLASIKPGIRFAFACSAKPLDTDILKNAIPREWGETRIAPIPAKPPVMRPVKLAKFIASWGPSVRAARALIRELPEHTAIVSLGGYVAPPVAQAARSEKKPIAVLNIDASPGKANAWIKQIGRASCRERV